MATYDMTPNRFAVGGTVSGTSSVRSTLHPSPRTAGVRIPYFVENVIDLARFNSDAGTASGDIIRVLDIPADTLVILAGVEVLTTITSGSTATFDVELDSTNTANHFAAAKSEATGVLSTSNATALQSTDANTADTFPIANNTLELHINSSTVTAGRVRVYALLLDMSNLINTESHPDFAYDNADTN